jgi:cystathionine gamma-synthase
MPDPTADDTWSPATIAVTAGRPPHGPDQPLNTPITMASTYGATGELEYGRYGNPTWTAFEEALGALEGGRCLAFSSGLATVSTVLDLVGQGATVVAPRHAYNRTVIQLADLG